ncbi:hypothetical protein AMATHDRAFT_55791 [Amanita thiersii Skay4041]|uniref:Uncharacterized protein n=1 Tax=Amanita thiersii Skay4041 TaxID=703135 RepID=A0A2A9NU84_9AGAR|nr:hypothetical protein AMATHDRAFT_55791 [Amanita thiersii Skay4041]
MSSAIVRRVAGTHTALSRQFPLLFRQSTPAFSRSYASGVEEPDPQLNGYPQLPWVSRQSLPPKGWNDDLMRRNYGDTLHEQEEVLSMWGPDVAPLPPQTALKQFLLAAAGFVGFGYFIRDYITPDVPAIRREYPYDGLVTELGGMNENKARVERG